MITAARSAPGSSHVAIAAALAACLLATLVAVSWPGDAGSAPLRVLVMGRTAAPPPPQCPLQPCKVEGRVTGFQSLLADGTPRPFQAPYEGKVISWSITLGNPAKADKAFFNDLFTRPSVARISILKRISRKPPVFRLVRQGPLQVLNPYFGETVEFALEHPLTVLENQVVALTIPTWAPMFAETGNDRDTWRASRRTGRCTFNNLSPAMLQERINQSHPQQRMKSKRLYECYYSINRLLYTATLVKKPGR